MHAAAGQQAPGAPPGAARGPGRIPGMGRGSSLYRGVSKVGRTGCASSSLGQLLVVQGVHARGCRCDKSKYSYMCMPSALWVCTSPFLRGAWHGAFGCCCHLGTATLFITGRMQEVMTATPVLQAWSSLVVLSCHC